MESGTDEGVAVASGDVRGCDGHVLLRQAEARQPVADSEANEVAGYQGDLLEVEQEVQQGSRTWHHPRRHEGRRQSHFGFNKLVLETLLTAFLCQI